MMGETTGITWCDHTFNPWIGCSKVSEGCTNCYAARENRRYHWVDEWGVNGERRKTSEANWKKPLAWNAAAKRDGVRRRVFCGSLCDVFEGRMGLELWFVELTELIYLTPNLDWLLLTKRPEHVMRITPYIYKLDNVWLGVTAENQAMADLRIPILMTIPASVRFVSVEPMLEEVSVFGYIYGPPWWVICGGESGPNARPMELDWARDLRDQCRLAGVPFFMKQINGKLKHLEDFPEDLRIREFPRLETK